MKVKVIKESVIYQGEIYKTNDSFDVDYSIAMSLKERGYVIEADNIPNDSQEEVQSVNLDKENLEKMKLQDLKKLASDLGLTANGKKEEIINEILNNDAVSLLDSDESEDELPNTSMPE